MKSILIDADSLIYIIAYHHKDSSEFYVHQACDSLLADILKQTEADQYLGVFSDPKESWRKSVYKYAPYKGTREEKPEWVTQWMTTIKEYYFSLGGFYELSHGLEADDILGIPFPVLDLTLCSPDKDIRQVPGSHYDYKSRTFTYVVPLIALKNKYMLMLCGDVVDNIKGVPKIGEVKATALLSACIDEIDMHNVVQQEFVKAFGSYYGPIIFKETETVVNIQLEQQPEEIKTILVNSKFDTLFVPTHKNSLEDLLS